MTRVALIADIHANLQGLEAVLADVNAKSVDAVFDLGDLVGYGPSPNEVVELLRHRGIPSVCGNHDHKVYRFGLRRAEYAATKRSLSFRSFQWTYDALTEDNLAYLRSLPAERRALMDGVDFRLVHTCQEVAPERPSRRPSDCVVAFAHSHVPSIQRIGSTVFINAGTVGRGSRGDLRASYALVEIDDGRVSAAIQWVPYDLGPLLQALLASGLPDAYVEMFRRGVHLDQVADRDTGELL